MAHVPRTTIHAFADRALTILVDVDTDLIPGDLTSVIFQAGSITKTGLTPTAGGSGIQIEVAMTDADLDITPGTYGWECRATVGGQVAVVAAGLFQLAAEPTAAA